LAASQLISNASKAVMVTASPPMIERDVLTFDVTDFAEALPKCNNKMDGNLQAAENADHRHRRLPRVRPRPRRAAERG
jgi:hypothetical protein